MILGKSFLNLLIFVILAAIYINNYNQVEANLLQKLISKQVEEEFRFGLNRRLSNQINILDSQTTSTKPIPSTSTIITDQQCNENINCDIYVSRFTCTGYTDDVHLYVGTLCICSCPQLDW